MSLFSRMFQTVQTWRRGKRAKVTQRTTVRIEQLDHRRLLSVNFTGNVPIDFPATQSPGVVVLPDNPSVVHPTIAPVLQPYVFKSGFDIQNLAVTYTPADDTLSIGLNGPPASPTTTQSVIAGDADDNGNSGTVNPNVLTVEPSFQDFPDFGGSEFEGAFLDLKGTGYADIVAGFSATDPRSPKQYQVANAIVNTSLPPSTPGFGTELPGFEGNVYTVNASAHPSLEFSISHFSQLYQQVTGKALTPDSVIAVGGFGGSANDTGISETFFPEQDLVVSAAPPSAPNPPPVAPHLDQPPRTPNYRHQPPRPGPGLYLRIVRLPRQQYQSGHRRARRCPRDRSHHPEGQARRIPVRNLCLCRGPVEPSLRLDDRHAHRPAQDRTGVCLAKGSSQPTRLSPFFRYSEKEDGRRFLL